MICKSKATEHSYYSSSKECISNTEKCVHTPALDDATHRKYVKNERVFYHLASAVSAFVKVKYSMSTTERYCSLIIRY